MRARYPDKEGLIERDVEIHYEVYGTGEPTLLLIPAAPITHSRSWKGQISYLSRHFRVVTLDGRGNGRSSRPTKPEDHTRSANVADILAVLDATVTDQTVLVAHCHANWWAVELAHAHPDRVLALVAIAPGVPYLGRSHDHWKSASATFDERLDEPVGWRLYNRHVISTQYRRWLEFFFTQQLPEPHSTKQLEDMIGWGLESTGEVFVAGEEGTELATPDRETFEASCRGLEIPVLVLHGDLDPCQPVDRGRAFSEITNGELVVIEGAGHLTPAREPVKVNLAIKAFIEEVRGAHARS